MMLLLQLPAFRAILLAIAAINISSHTVLAFVPPQSNQLSTSYTLQAEASSSSEREPWDIFRFAQQSSRFIQLPNPFRQSQEAVSVNPGDLLWVAGGDDSSALPSSVMWSPLDDIVMGGVSSSGFDNVSGQWSGNVSSKNNGGFVGIRTTPFVSALDMSGCNGIEIRVRGGSGRRFKAALRDSTDFNGIVWAFSFDTKKGNGGSSVIRLPFDKLVPTLFAKSVPDKTFQRDNTVGFQLAYSKFEYDGDLNSNFELGDFNLQLMEIRSF